MSAFHDSLKELTQVQIVFLSEECGIDREELFNLSDDDLYDRVYDVMCDIETAETPTDQKQASDRCKIASDIVTVMGNALATDHGLFDEEEFLSEMSDSE